MNTHNPVPNQMLKTARLEKCWTLATAAEKANVSIEAYSRWELGKQEPRLSSLLLLCEAFGKSPEDIGFGPRTKSSHLQKKQDGIKEYTEPTRGPSPSLLPRSQQIMVLAPEQVTAFQQLLGLGDDMNAFDQPKRNVLATFLSATQEDSPPGSSLTATVSRRHAIASIIGTTAAALGLSQVLGSPQLHPQEALMLCASSIPLCWSLYFEGGLSETKAHITPYLTQLSTLARHPAFYQKQAAALTSQAYQLSALVEILFHNLGTALDHAKCSVEFARLTDDANLLTAAYIRLAVVYSNLHRPQLRLAAYQHALQHVQGTSPLLQARVYAGLMETQSVLENKKAAYQFRDLTNTTTPGRFEADPNFSYTHFDPWSIHMYEKDMWINLGNPEEAWKTLEKSHQIVEQGLTVNRVDLTIKQAEMSVLLGNLEQSHDYLTRGLLLLC